jgi:hypothetical protein
MASGIRIDRRCSCIPGCSGSVDRLRPGRSDQPADAGIGWQYTASIYAYVPSVEGTSSFPADGGGTRLNLESSILDKLKVFAMGTVGAHNGTWGVFTDIVYLKFEASESASRDFTIGNAGLPADASAAFDWDMRGTAWTLAGSTGSRRPVLHGRRARRHAVARHPPAPALEYQRLITARSGGSGR